MDPGFAGGVGIVHDKGDGLCACGDGILCECGGTVLPIACVFDWYAAAVAKGI
ncbi:MAG: hypothetical protein HF977_15815 [ANME-2 cluster archaeon]|nr:hypothetical protein [ANME-2 cluster archaeon]